MSPDYHELFDLLNRIEKLLPKVWPPELPPETTADFWEAATRQEFKHRTVLTERIRTALNDGFESVASWTPIEVWLYQRRIEWATQVAYEAAKQGLSCSDSPETFLTDLIVNHWNDQGAIAFWNHAMERNGAPHPEADAVVQNLLSLTIM